MSDKKYLWYRYFQNEKGEVEVMVLNCNSKKPSHISEFNFNTKGELKKEFHLTEEEAKHSPYFELMSKFEIRIPKEDKMYYVKLKNTDISDYENYLNVAIDTDNIFFHDFFESTDYQTKFTYEEALKWTNDNKMLEMVEIS